MLDMIRGWVAANTHGHEQNTDMVPWGKRRLAIDYSRDCWIDSRNAGVIDSIRWALSRLKEHAMNGLHYLAVIEIVRTWDDEPSYPDDED